MTRNCPPRHHISKASEWSPLEVRLLEQNRTKTAHHIARILAEHGVARTHHAITNQLYRLGLRADVESAEPIDYRGLDAKFCAALRAAHPDKETGPIRWRHRDGIPTIIPRAIRSLGSGWQIDGGSGL